MHVAMFLISLKVETILYTDPDQVSLDIAIAEDRAQISGNYYEYQVFLATSYGHAATALILLVTFWLKYQDEYVVSKFILIPTYFTSLLP